MKQNTTTTDYQQQGLDFLTETNTTMTVKFLKSGYHWEGDKEVRDIYQITLERGPRKYTFNFGQSIANSGFYYKKGVKVVPIDRKYLGTKNLVPIIKNMDYSFNQVCDKIHRPTEPTAYDILTCLTKNDPGTLEDFCGEFGYDTDSKKAEKTYNAVKEEYLQVSRLFNESELEKMAEIQ